MDLVCFSPQMSTNRLHPSERCHSGRPSGILSSVGLFGIFQISSLFLKYSSGRYTLWREGVKHGDITISNLTHRNGTGVFNDLDYNSTTSHPRKFDRHGPTAFLALELINWDGVVEAERRYRHGLESFFWVLLWISSCYDDNVRTIPASQRRWLHHDIVKSWCFKKGVLTLDEDIPITKSYRPLEGPIHLFKYYWMTYFFEQKPKNGSPFSMKRHLDPPSGPIDSEPAMESVEDVERMFFRLRAAFEEPRVAHLLDRLELVPDIPRALFPNYAKLQSGDSESNSIDGANHGWVPCVSY